MYIYSMRFMYIKTGNPGSWKHDIGIRTYTSKGVIILGLGFYSPDPFRAIVLNFCSGEFYPPLKLALAKLPGKQ